MIKFKIEQEKKKKEKEKEKGNQVAKPMEEIFENTKSNGEIFLIKQMPEIEEELRLNVPQARFIKESNKIMDFNVEYKPDSDSYWYGGKYLFSFHFTDDFPNEPPKVLCKTKIYHPNIDYDGNVCLNILKEDWKPVFSASKCIAAVYQLFVEPNPNDPLNHDVAKLMRDNIEQFKVNVKRTLRGGYQFGQEFPRFTEY